LGERLNLPVFKGVPVGHGPHHQTLYLGKKHALSSKGIFKILK
jgi:muramoyltetrapeptide carboxypeptidase LdcA involved in peptidoglycan recycling